MVKLFAPLDLKLDSGVLSQITYWKFFSHITPGSLKVDGPKIQLVLDQGYSAPSAKIVTAGVRLYGLVAGELFFAYDMAAEGQELQAHIWSSLERQSE